MTTSRTFAIALALTSTLAAACGTTDINVGAVPAADAATDRAQQADASATDTTPRMVCGDGVCSDRNLDCAADCRDMPPPADAGPQCGTGAQVCPGTTGCTDLRTDTANCGACGRTCTTGQICSAGVCANPPPACGGANLATDVRNCGTCGHACSTGQACVMGMCSTPMPTGSSTTGEDVWEVTYTTAAGDDALNIENWIMTPVYRSCEVTRGSGPLLSSTCTFRVPRSLSATQRPWFNAHFTLPPTPRTAPQTISTWAVYAPTAGVSDTYGGVSFRKNGVPVPASDMEIVENAMHNGFNWSPRR